MRRLALTALAVVAFSLPALAQDTRETRLARAQDYVAQSMMDLDLEAVVRSMYRPVLDQVAASGRQLSQDQIDRIDALYMATMLEPLRAIMMQQDQVMADLFTLEEIEALLAFYTSPVGRSVMTKMPQLMEVQQPAILNMVQSTMPTLIPQLQAIIAR